MLKIVILEILLFGSFFWKIAFIWHYWLWIRKPAWIQCNYYSTNEDLTWIVGSNASPKPRQRLSKRVRMQNKKQLCLILPCKVRQGQGSYNCGLLKMVLKWHYHEHFFLIIQKYNACLIFLPNFKAKFVHLHDFFTILICQFYGRH
jgi:hypothetical protein